MSAKEVDNVTSDFFDSLFTVGVFYHKAGIALPDVARYMIRGGVSVFMSHLKDKTDLPEDAIVDAIAILVTSELNSVTGDMDINLDDDELEVLFDED